MFLNVPVLAFRVFELLVAPLFIVKTIIIVIPSKFPMFLRVALFFIFTILNCYIYIFKNPIFFN
jgi:hypothetical protein